MDQQSYKESSGRGSLLSILLALFFGGGFLLFLILVTGGFFMYVVSIVGAIAILGLLHYVVWGEAMTREVAAERAAEEAKARLEARELGQEHPHGIRQL